MAHERRARWNAIYGKYGKAMDEWPSLCDDAETHRAAWKEIHRYAEELEGSCRRRPTPCCDTPLLPLFRATTLGAMRSRQPGPTDHEYATVWLRVVSLGA
jgi:hypothetical protein